MNKIYLFRFTFICGDTDEDIDEDNCIVTLDEKLASTPERAKQLITELSNKSDILLNNDYHGENEEEDLENLACSNISKEEKDLIDFTYEDGDNIDTQLKCMNELGKLRGIKIETIGDEYIGHLDGYFEFTREW